MEHDPVWQKNKQLYDATHSPIGIYIWPLACHKCIRTVTSLDNDKNTCNPE